MCRLNINNDLDPRYPAEEGEAPDEYSFDDEEEEEQAIGSTTEPSFFPQDYINNSEMAFLIIKRQLMLLIHSNYCLKIDHLFPDRPQCTMQNCNNFKLVLSHLKVCSAVDCLTPRCVSSRNILRHYTNCFCIDCNICF